MILHLCPAADWEAVPPGGSYRAASLDDAGFIHCSDPGTVHLPANRLYAGRTDLVVLWIDPALLGVPVRWEPGEPGETPWFPHVYGPVPSAAVRAVLPYRPGPDGRFVPPTTPPPLSGTA
ncbi:glutathione S-transferase [Saccharomonospora piscinae]|uniref:Glutathione S-transferase n=1 Tax=Saccharomonospora piscinae TaxID=687388 RepID=A0A1V9A174_SACPI|nr:DUF952 domain-containing protein [Saccharomonospora piscinae]OQO90786.1 glutathione S-transferase [Saccharomonospora piscinae]